MRAGRRLPTWFMLGGLVIVTLVVLLAMGLVGADHEPGFLVQRAVNDDEVPMA
jgi:hypothetical protein